SGGIDSSLVTTIAVDAIGPERVHPIALPSRFSTQHSISDAEQLCSNPGLELRTIAIEPAHQAMLDMLHPLLQGLSPDITDQNLPPYDVLDPILTAYVEGDHTRSELITAGFDPAIVERVTRLVDVAEWKRRQAPIGVRVTPKAFGKDRRLPITNHYAG